MKGQTLGSYVILEQLAVGGMASVYSASHTRLSSLVAIKILHPHYQEDQEVRSRFLDEARILASLRHANILAVQDILETQNHTGIVMDLLEGTSLEGFYRSRGRFRSPGQILWLFRRVADALAFAHSRGVVHRDLKPSNIFLRCLSGSVVPTLMDFGIAKHRSLGRRAQWTTLGAALGTPQYMAPEQFEDSSTVDGRADVFALGVLLYEALCGALPFDAPSPAEVMNAVFHSAPKRPSALRSGVPADLEEVCMKCLQRDRSVRYPSAERLLGELTKAASRHGDEALSEAEVRAPGGADGDDLPGSPEAPTRVEAAPSPPPMPAPEARAQVISLSGWTPSLGPQGEETTGGAPGPSKAASGQQGSARTSAPPVVDVPSTGSFQAAQVQEKQREAPEALYPLAGYTITERLRQGVDTVVYRAVRNSDGMLVVVKTLWAEHPQSSSVARIKNEFRLASSLSLPGVMRTVELVPYRNSVALVSEDFGGRPLKEFVASPRYKPRLWDTLELGIKLAETLAAVHDRGVVHRDINPMNIVLNAATGEVRIVDFGQASVLSGQEAEASPGVVEGTPAYMSPEQTGRMNRRVDHRSDLYSLGVTFYEMMTGSQPFEGTERSELLYAHVAKQPVPLDRITPEVPPAVSAVVLKLMAKNAEDRYQSARGLMADLQECLRQLHKAGWVTDFALGRLDVSERLQFPQKLYGRDAEMKALAEALDDASRGARRLALVSGYAGVGKTTLVRELHRSVTRERVYFVTGKFDQYKREVPYGAFIEAFQQLVREVLTEGDVPLVRWRERLTAVLGATARVIVDVVPEVEHIVGKTAPVPDLPPEEALNRMCLTMQRFVAAFADPEHPLVVFLDDLQWADLASLKLVSLLMTSSSLSSLLLVGAYRDNEVDATHALPATVEEVRRGGLVPLRLDLKPLLLKDVSNLMSDALRCPWPEVQELAVLLHAKTGGNPFFVRETVRTLTSQGMLHFDRQAGAWRWDLEEVKQSGISDDIVDLMTRKIGRLRPATQQAVKLGACVGSQFDVQTLSVVSGLTAAQVQAALKEAVGEGLVLALGEEHRHIASAGPHADPGMLDAVLLRSVRYRFSHDRIQQAAYTLLPEDIRRSVHSQIGLMLLRETPEGIRGQRIFEIVNQLNAGGGAAASGVAPIELAALNLEAGRRAKSSAAYDSAFKFLQGGLALLPADCWKSHYELSVALHSECAEAAYLCTRFDEMERLVGQVLDRAEGLSDRIAVYEVRIQGYIAQARKEEAVATALSVLSMLGVDLPKEPRMPHVLKGLLAAWAAIGLRSVQDLERLPALTDPRLLTALRLLSRISSTAYVVKPNLFPLIVLKQVELSARHGNSAYSCFAYALYGCLSCAYLGRIPSGYAFGRLALTLMERYEAKELRPRILFTVASVVQHFVEPVTQTMGPLRQAHLAGLDVGDLEFATASAGTYAYAGFFVGRPLAELESELSAYAEVAEAVKQTPYLSYLRLVLDAIADLRGLQRSGADAPAARLQVEARLARYRQEHDSHGEHNLHLLRMLMAYLAGNAEEAVRAADAARERSFAVLGMVPWVVFSFLDALSRTRLAGVSTGNRRLRLLNQARKSIGKLKKLARHAPANHAHRLTLARAEFERVVGRLQHAERLFDRALEEAQRTENLLEIGMAAELAARHYIGTGRVKVARAFLADAAYAFSKWGAGAKLASMRGQYGELLAPEYHESPAMDALVTVKDDTGPLAGRQAEADVRPRLWRAACGDPELEPLVEGVLSELVNHSGARYGLLALDQGDRLLVEGEYWAEDNRTVVGQHAPLKLEDDLPHMAINYALRVQEPVVLEDARNSTFARDPYVEKEEVRSLLCMPLTRGQKVFGLLYLENDLTPGAFSAERARQIQSLTPELVTWLEAALRRREQAE